METEAAAAEQNRSVYEHGETVKHYGQATGLQPAEEILLSRHLIPRAKVLDIGIGGGRTTAELRGRAGTYVGIDYAAAMVAEASKRFPDLDLRVMDASDLSSFADAAFDLVLFSFNGIDYLHPAASRARFLTECRRVLRPGGKLIYSSHNPRWTVVLPDLRGASAVKTAWRVGLSFARTGQRCLGSLFSADFWNGGGSYHLDPVHGGLVTYSVSAGKGKAEIEAAGFRYLEHAGGSCYPSAPSFCQPWIYFAAEKAP